MIQMKNYVIVPAVKSSLVAKNIKKVLSQLKIKYNPERKGPHTSATFYKNNLFKVGSNGNIWFIKSNKWVEIKDTIVKTITPFSLKNGTL